MKKLLFILSVVAVAAVAIAQEYKNRQPTPDEARWTAGIFDLGTASSTNSTQAVPNRVGKARIGVNVTTLTITNAGVTTNAFIAANLEYIGLEGTTTNNYISSVTPGSGEFTVRLKQPPTSNTVVRWFILNY